MANNNYNKKNYNNFARVGFSKDDTYVVSLTNGDLKERDEYTDKDGNTKQFKTPHYVKYATLIINKIEKDDNGKNVYSSINKDTYKKIYNKIESVINDFKDAFQKARSETPDFSQLKELFPNLSDKELKNMKYARVSIFLNKKGSISIRIEDASKRNVGLIFQAIRNYPPLRETLGLKEPEPKQSSKDDIDIEF